MENLIVDCQAVEETSKHTVDYCPQEENSKLEAAKLEQTVICSCSQEWNVEATDCDTLETNDTLVAQRWPGLSKRSCLHPVHSRDYR